MQNFSSNVHKTDITTTEDETMFQIKDAQLLQAKIFREQVTLPNRVTASKKNKSAT